MHWDHPFDRYAPFTDIVALKEWSAKPLLKSVRVNTLKCSMGRFQEWAREKVWTLEPVPWYEEGFFVERADREEALGKDLLHFIGGFYIQEAASMLPVALLDPQPGDAVLDMSAAPGSKTTQIAAIMTHPLPSEGRGQGEGGVRGVIVANDIQEHRLWTLKSALHRSGVTNVIVTKKVGQWFGKHMTERFNRVLCDVPCTAQGTVRKDSDALNYCGQENIEKMARLQGQLLEAAIHAAKVGGRIVYSTCTLTPEENEGTVLSVLEKYHDQLEILDPRSLLVTGYSLFDRTINDSVKVQEWLVSQHSSNQKRVTSNVQPLLRLWPQTYDTEGFFCAVLEKRASTRGIEHMEYVPFQEERLSVDRQNGIAAKIEDLYGVSFLTDTDVLFRSGEQLFLMSEEVAGFPLPVQDYSVGIPFAKLLNDGRVRVSHEMATLRGISATRALCSIGDQQLVLLLEGKDVPGDTELHGDILLLYKDFCIGRALAKNGVLKNNLPRWMVRD
ncbi:hypothetical protein A3H22_03285 [Candidatus Peribacteria bacterium RIFCSPLOWO2_12_FULL_55_15]|nr:MAG: hypothetical protein A2789_01730 [Candidatus Peribacteria bacterium RIFCSPHIGHO2_01_FULL_54_22]OGJ63753.1 MAG: hypothetical protein A3D12_01680 [Candidatus Peribacteria bacterium RIFCSPHIGHO2_02_FULL_55_24]OGJ65259.1 MAG: hypothetical protein A3E47_00585 [Candidatus Peribacteria bacterium RIFCSPHIGHO2_12_FULL_54_10]OGJ68808.1 MAG: hypothetical protein A3H90_03110 [Candidatus Peribacteria bacterium RIFCSPLOWO2_02_FULL_55_36]OGJ69015.1 MAG: hypothetical protein A2947_01755 [Candidatus Per